MTRELQGIEITLDGVGHTLSDRRLRVPIYQRSYAWEDKQVIDLLQDIFSSLRSGGQEYFIGSIVISANNNENEVVDGQQRLATISVIIAAIRDYFFENSDRPRADGINNKYLAVVDIRSQETISKLKLNGNDHTFFYQGIISLPDCREIRPSRESHYRLKRAYELAKTHIKNFLSNSNNPTDALMDLLEFIENNLKVIIVLVPNHANAFTIFETLNDRGLELAISDLLKNYLFGRSEDRINEVQANWTEMYALLENTENELLIVTFIRHYWSSIYGLTRERVLYDEIKRKITSKQRTVDLSFNLSKFSKIYIAIIDASNSFWNDFSDETKVHIENLNLFGMVQVRPLLLAIISKFNRPETERAIKLLVSSSVRFLIHGGLGGGALETQYSQTAKEINEGLITTATNLVDRMRTVIPNDEQFKESFKTANVSKPSLARYYLMVLEKCYNGSLKPELVPNSDTTAVNLEHVLPKNPDSSWGLTEEKVKVLHNRLGNLALLSSKLNSEIGNASFELKKTSYQNSSFNLTKSIYDLDEWNEEKILARQEQLSNLAIQAWSINI